MALSRRSLLGTGAAAGVGLVAATASGSLAAPAAADAVSRRRTPQVPGPLLDDPAGLLALPAGFTYRVVSVAGETTLLTGEKSPDRPDGTGAFRWRDRIRLVQNHEQGPGAALPVPQVAGTVYDAAALGGGCTVIEVTGRGHRVAEWVGLSGTISNCAGGVTPWGTWLTCEETEVRAGATSGGATLAEDHGWIFEVAPGPGRQRPVPIRPWGRYPHEAVVVEPSRRRVYLTEDASSPNGLLYRWTSDGPRLREGSLQDLGPTAGRLEALKVEAPDGGHLDDLSRITAQYLNRPLRTSWVPVPDRLAITTSTRKQFAADQVTRSKKLEGAWGDREGFFFDSSYAHAGDVPAGSVQHDGQIWYYHYGTGTLTLKAYFPYVAALHAADADPAALRGLGVTYFDGPDNVHVTPWGGLVIAEDGDGDNHLVGWTEATGAWPLARNQINAADELASAVYNELTGPTFSPDGRLLFANVQEPGHTFAISADFARYFG
jgi:secreted PhoX family phosphatase